MLNQLDSIDALLIFASFFITVIFVITIKKIYYRFRFNRRVYIFPRINVKGIANIAMVISIAIAILLLLTFISAGLLGVLFRAYPGWRVTIEGILIKVGGLLFGPIIGVFIGAATDLLSIALTAGMFHYGYFIAAMMYGLLAGIVKSILNITKGKQVRFAFWSTLLIGIVGLASVLYIMLQPKAFHITFLIDFNIPQWLLGLLIISIYAVGLLVLWSCTFAYYRNTIRYNLSEIHYWFKYKTKILRFRHRLTKSEPIQEVVDQHLIWCTRFGAQANETLIYLNQRKQHIENNQKNWLTFFAPVLIMILFGEALISVFILPEFDVMFSIPSPDMYNMWLGVRSVMLLITIPLNIAVIYPVYRIVCPAMKYNYMDDSVESRSIPLMID